ncbi:MAG: hypothetical protein HN981_00960 [Candidatus Pacebacteria bacterium]|jgi:competence protein ComEC|nr:hypothetical protein [Candidatus Paceibacterota bacterium]MBT4651839.1 hypothetical protein [Candidatus Paceibacterota bacterium]MBT6756513.1 hypothetical protein [Candidatus Paceibacterota bacterium]MBT6920946.1 hypothetical protein [Candidatus Paceibacterota bacterium]
MKITKKTAFFLLSFFIVLAYFIYKKWPDRSIKVVFCDVGQGDSILIQQGFFQVLLDSGKDDRVLGCLGYVLPFWDRVIEVGIVSHFDSDHMGYFGEVMGMFSWKEIYSLQSTKKTLQVQRLLEAFERAISYGTVAKQPVLGQTIVLPSGAKIIFLEVESFLKEKNIILSENDRTLGVLLEVGDKKWLFTGDGEDTWESSLLEIGVLPQVDVLKIGHHGSLTSSSVNFLERVAPELAVISVGSNSFGHPHKETLDNLQERGVKILRTDKSGDIIFSTNGEQIWIDEVRKRP